MLVTTQNFEKKKHKKTLKESLKQDVILRRLKTLQT